MAAELVELGFEGVNKLTDKYHDQVYDNLPTLPKWKKKEKQQAQNQKGQHPNSSSRVHPDKGHSNSRSYPPAKGDPYYDDRDMYEPDRKQTRYTEERYYEDEPADYRAPGPGFKVEKTQREYGGSPRGAPGRDEYAASSRGAPGRDEYAASTRGAPGRDEYAASPRGAPGREEYAGNTRGGGTQMTPYQQPPYGQQQQPQRGYEQNQVGAAYGRSQSGRRGSSWSPPRSERQGRTDSRQPKSRSRSRSKDLQHRIMATVGGAVIGGIAGNQATKGKKYDTFATIAGAVLGGVGAKEASEQWDKRQRKKEMKNDEWDGDYDDEKDDRRRDDSRRPDSRREESRRDDSRRGESRRDDRYGREDRYDRDDRYDDRRGY